MTTTINHKTYKPVSVCKTHLEQACTDVACKGQPTRTILRETAAGAPDWTPRPQATKRLVVKVRGEKHGRWADEGAAWGALVRASEAHDKARAVVGEGPREGEDGSPSTVALRDAMRTRFGQIRCVLGTEAAEAFEKAYREARA